MLWLLILWCELNRNILCCSVNKRSEKFEVKIFVKVVIKLFQLHMSVKLLFAKLGWLRIFNFLWPFCVSYWSSTVWCMTRLDPLGREVRAVLLLQRCSLTLNNLLPSEFQEKCWHVIPDNFTNQTGRITGHRDCRMSIALYNGLGLPCLQVRQSDCVYRWLEGLCCHISGYCKYYISPIGPSAWLSSAARCGRRTPV